MGITKYAGFVSKSQKETWKQQISLPRIEEAK